MQKELEIMAKLMAESIAERDSKNNLYKFYLILVTIISLLILAISLLVFFYLNDRNIIKNSATIKYKTDLPSEAPNNQICFNTDNEKLLKVRNVNGVKWVYKTYHNEDELVYITIAK